MKKNLDEKIKNLLNNPAQMTQDDFDTIMLCLQPDYIKYVLDEKWEDKVKSFVKKIFQLLDATNIPWQTNDLNKLCEYAVILIVTQKTSPRLLTEQRSKFNRKENIDINATIHRKITNTDFSPQLKGIPIDDSCYTNDKKSTLDTILSFMIKSLLLETLPHEQDSKKIAIELLLSYDAKILPPSPLNIDQWRNFTNISYIPYELKMQILNNYLMASLDFINNQTKSSYDPTIIKAEQSIRRTLIIFKMQMYEKYVIEAINAKNFAQAQKLLTASNDNPLHNNNLLKQDLELQEIYMNIIKSITKQLPLKQPFKKLENSTEIAMLNTSLQKLLQNLDNLNELSPLPPREHTNNAPSRTTNPEYKASRLTGKSFFSCLMPPQRASRQRKYEIDKATIIPVQPTESTTQRLDNFPNFRKNP